MTLQLGRAKFICTSQFRHKATHSASQGHKDYIKRIENVQYIKYK